MMLFPYPPTPTPPHRMALAKTRESGAEEWLCPVCGRRLLVSWEPWNKTVLTPGDEKALHAGARRGMGFDGLETANE